MDPAVLGVIGALAGAAIGAGAAIVNSIIMNRHQRQLEREKSQLEVTETMTGELRLHLAQAAQAMLSAQHSMEWICWHALFDQHLIDEATISQYHQEIHETFPKILGSLAIVASFDTKLYNDLHELEDKIYKIDGKIARALVKYKDSPGDIKKTLAELFSEAAGLYKELPLELAGIMQSAREKMYS